MPDEHGAVAAIFVRRVVEFVVARSTKGTEDSIEARLASLSGEPK